MTLQEAKQHIGDRVVYEPVHQGEKHRREGGVIESVGTAYVFVRYDGDGASKATHPADLRLES